ncbi:hypothetical protein O9G_004573 [Rozella allomycis CSF55]|uniref:Pentacotripeptide-repeat region of PRORP domain-containing protein n=1 Tax=Rozella allomycis (strain CSF55) TaxID=988480 RepID=A0A075AXK3_ROZAC|nr:hypothetical protein O9G_004573 [Rozella allomycis CSF55]|eukprot:EPZ34977.1 hypothetical protein O9G_004573 [Rozella allomycis CSF55]
MFLSKLALSLRNPIGFQSTRQFSVHLPRVGISRPGPKLELQTPDHITEIVSELNGLHATSIRLFKERVKSLSRQELKKIVTLRSSKFVSLGLEILKEIEVQPIRQEMATRFLSAHVNNAKFFSLVDSILNEESFLTTNVLNYILVVSFARKQRTHFDKCLELFERTKLKYDKETFAILINSYGKLGKFEEMRDLFEKMKSEDIHPTIKIFNMMLSAYSERNKDAEIEVLIDEMRNLKFNPDISTFNILINYNVLNKNYEKARILYEEAKDNEFETNFYTHAIMMKLFAELKDYSSMKSHFDSCVSKRTDKDEVGTTFNVYIQGLASMNYFEEMIEIYKELQQLKSSAHFSKKSMYELNAKTINSMIECFHKNSKFGELVNFSKEELRLFDSKCLLSLFNSLKDAGRSEEALDIINSFLIQGKSYLDRNAIEAYFKACAQAEKFKEIMEFYDENKDKVDITIKSVCIYMIACSKLMKETKLNDIFHSFAKNNEVKPLIISTAMESYALMGKYERVWKIWVDHNNDGKLLNNINPVMGLIAAAEKSENISWIDETFALLKVVPSQNLSVYEAFFNFYFLKQNLSKCIELLSSFLKTQGSTDSVQSMALKLLDKARELNDMDLEIEVLELAGSHSLQINQGDNHFDVSNNSLN